MVRLTQLRNNTSFVKALFSYLIITYLVFFSLPKAHAEGLAIDGVMLSYGQGMTDALIQYKDISGAQQYSLGLFWDTDYTFQHDLLGHAELSVEAYWSKISKQQTMKVLALRPVLTFWESQQKTRIWYWQAGLGVSYFDNKHLDPIEFSSNAQFAMIFGIGMPLDKAKQHQLTLRYNHYSNGYTSRPNQGLDTLTLDWHYRL